jgi:hypothetical protein
MEVNDQFRVQAALSLGNERRYHLDTALRESNAHITLYLHYPLRHHETELNEAQPKSSFSSDT